MAGSGVQRRTPDPGRRAVRRRPPRSSRSSHAAAAGADGARRRWRTVVATGVTGLRLCAVAAAIWGLDAVVEWLDALPRFEQLVSGAVSLVANAITPYAALTYWRLNGACALLLAPRRAAMGLAHLPARSRARRPADRPVRRRLPDLALCDELRAGPVRARPPRPTWPAGPTAVGPATWLRRIGQANCVDPHLPPGDLIRLRALLATLSLPLQKALPPARRFPAAARRFFIPTVDPYIPSVGFARL